MKKTVILVLLTLVCTLTFAVPNGCYEGVKRPLKGRCALKISGNVLKLIQSDGDELLWTIRNEEKSNDGTRGVLNLESKYGAVQTATWWIENGKTYLNFGFTYVLMQSLLFQIAAYVQMG